MEHDKCSACGSELYKHKNVVAIEGLILCVKCAKERYSKQELYDLAEIIPPDYIGGLK